MKRELPFSKRRQLEKAGNGIGLRKTPPLDAPVPRSFRMPRRRKPAAVIEADIWREGLEPCAVCGTRVDVDGHHCVPKRVLKRLGHHTFLLDKRNRLALCRDHHESHENRSKPVPRRLLPASAWEFAAELDLTSYLERHYVDAVEQAA